LPLMHVKSGGQNADGKARRCKQYRCMARRLQCSKGDFDNRSKNPPRLRLQAMAGTGEESVEGTLSANCSLSRALHFLQLHREYDAKT